MQENDESFAFEGSSIRRTPPPPNNQAPHFPLPHRNQPLSLGVTPIVHEIQRLRLEDLPQTPAQRGLQLDDPSEHHAIATTRGHNMSLLTFAEALASLQPVTGESEVGYFLEACDELFEIYASDATSREFAICVKRKIVFPPILNSIKGKTFRNYQEFRAALRAYAGEVPVPLLMQNLVSIRANPNEKLEEFAERVQQLLDSLNAASSGIAEGVSLQNLQKINTQTAITSFVRAIRNPRVHVILAAKEFASVQEALKFAQLQLQVQREEPSTLQSAPRNEKSSKVIPTSRNSSYNRGNTTINSSNSQHNSRESSSHVANNTDGEMNTTHSPSRARSLDRSQREESTTHDSTIFSPRFNSTRNNSTRNNSTRNSRVTFVNGEDGDPSTSTVGVQQFFWEGPKAGSP
ncbi:hypothetical protein DMENIID0001_169940 [Sergentomyia squamirostris]